MKVVSVTYYELMLILIWGFVQRSSGPCCLHFRGACSSVNLPCAAAEFSNSSVCR